MNKYFTIMIVPQKDKAIKSFKLPGFLLKSAALITVIGSALVAIFVYDYSQILNQIHENKHLASENRQLREQIQVFQMKLNSITGDLDRINTLEKKLRVITGLENYESLSTPLNSQEEWTPQLKSTEASSKKKKQLSSLFNFEEIKETELYQSYKGIYDQKIASNLGFHEGYAITQRWSELLRESFSLGREYASFDYKYSVLRKEMGDTERKVSELDEYLLDKQSMLNSTPTILPAQGWITSYYGFRLSPQSGRKKMHEGLDVGGRYGTPIVASADGIVTYSGDKAGFGNFVQVDHGYGIETLYAHSQKLHVKRGQKVSRGDLLAEIGNTGSSTGPHLHYEIRVNGIAVDPLYFVLQ